MFSLNSLNLVIKIVLIAAKGFEPATSCVRDEEATIVLTRNMCVREREDNYNLP